MVTENTQRVDTSSVSAIASLTDNGHACEREGYPILLLRKSAVNKAWASPYSPLFSLLKSSQLSLDDREPKEPLQDHNEVLRVLREGYVYILAGTANKKEYIRYYEVLEGGILREKAPEDLEVDDRAPFPVRCLADNHYVPASFISVDISNDELNDKPFLWIAYSRYPWNKETRDYYKNSQDLARFSQIDLKSFIQAPDGHSRGIDLSSEFILGNVLEFTPNICGKLRYLPNYQDKSEQRVPFTHFINARKYQYKKTVGAIILEDALGMAEDLNFQRLAEVNYTGDFKLHDKIDDKKSDIPYEYHELHTPEGQYKKLNYDLIEQYKIGVRQSFDENSKEGLVSFTWLDNFQLLFNDDKWQYGGTVGTFDQTGSTTISLSQSEKAHYDFDLYWGKLNDQLKQEEYHRFAEVVKRYEQIKKNNGRDYTLYCRWLFCDKLPASEFFTGRKQQLENKKEITFPEQKISRFNTVRFWEREFNYHNQGTHNDILGDAIQIFRTQGSSYYDMGLWDELLSSDETYFHKVIAGKNPSFWKESDIKSLADKSSELTNFLISTCLGNPIITLAQSQSILPDVAGQQLEKITNAQGVQNVLADTGHVNAKSRTITFNINTGKINALAGNKNISITSQAEIDGTKKTTITLTVFCDDDGFKNIEDYVKRTNRGNRAANDVNKLATVIDDNVVMNNIDSKKVNPHLITEEFSLTLPEERFNELDTQLKTKHGTHFSGFEVVNNKDGLITAKFKGQGTQESINELKAYLQKYASSSTSNRFATVKTLLTKITNNHIDVTIHANTMIEGAQEMGNVLKENVPSTTASESSPHLSNTPIDNSHPPKLRGAHAATSASILFELLLLAWQVKLLIDNGKKLQETNLTDEQRNETMSGLVFASVSITMNALKFVAESVDKLAKMAGQVENKLMVTLTGKAAALSEKMVMRALINFAETLNIMAKLWGALEGAKEVFWGVVKINSGFKTSGWWKVASGALLVASMAFGGSGIGIALSVVCIILSVFCTYMSELTSLNAMERWFDRCYFGLNQLNGNLSPYALTEDGVKKLIHGFYGASRGYELFLTKKSQSSLAFWDTKHDIYLNVILPNYKSDNIRYYGSLIVDKKESSQNCLIGHNLTGTTFKSTTFRDNTAGVLSTLEMKTDFTSQASQSANLSPLQIKW
ncbi:toxin VasX [Orbus mooreae]|uniref:toxin VasX n=1 Tax=Orbus mooreae TaxID=3074107 RepID=UPI00370D66D3